MQNELISLIRACPPPRPSHQTATLDVDSFAEILPDPGIFDAFRRDASKQAVAASRNFSTVRGGIFFLLGKGSPLEFCIVSTSSL